VLEVRQAVRPWNSPPKLLELLRVFQELDNFLQLLLGLIRSGDVLKRSLLLLRGEHRARDLPKLNALLRPIASAASGTSRNPREESAGAAFNRINTQSPLRTSLP